jgi:hypothetical protein
MNPLRFARKNLTRVIDLGEAEWMIPTLGEMDDLYAHNVRKDSIDVVPRDPDKIRKYASEISLLWRLLLTSDMIQREEDSPCSQFDHFVLGVFYTLAENDIRIGGQVVMERDEWLLRSLPEPRRLCDHHVNKLKRKEVATMIRTLTNLDVNTLKFSTKSRMYTSKVVSKGTTRVKKWLRMYDGKTSIDLVQAFIRQNSVVDYTQLGNTQGNIRRAARPWTKRPTLFTQ